MAERDPGKPEKAVERPKSSKETRIESLGTEDQRQVRVIKGLRYEIVEKGKEYAHSIYQTLENTSKPLLTTLKILNFRDFLRFLNLEPGYNPKRVMVLGDSQVEGMKYMGGLKKVVECSDNRGMGIDFMYKKLEKGFRKNPNYLADVDLLYVHAGGNSMWNLPLERMQELTMNLYNLVKAKAPNVRVVFGTITPRMEVIGRKRNSAKLATRLQKFNTWLRETFPGDIFDAYSVMEDPHKPGYQKPEFRSSKANVHFNPRGYKAMSTAFLQQFKIGEEAYYRSG